MLARVGAEIDPRVRLRELGIANKHLVAVARALSVDARVVIMDEPTAALSHKEIAELFDLVEKLKAEGKAILFISHKFDEIFRIADRYTVFRDGALVGEGTMGEVGEDALVTLMVGRSIDAIFPKRAHQRGEEVLEVAGYGHPTEFADIGFSLRQGEILGFYGLVGAGRSELMQALFGITRPSKGVVRIDGEVAVDPLAGRGGGARHRLRARGPRGAGRDPGNADLPERHAAVALAHLAARVPAARRGVPRWRASIPRGSTCAPPRSTRSVGQLSGGNQQKVVIAKWLATKPRVIILDEPTKGIDIGSKAAVHEFMAELGGAGARRDHGVVGNPRGPRHVGPRGGDARGADRRRPSSATG